MRRTRVSNVVPVSSFSSVIEASRPTLEDKRQARVLRESILEMLEQIEALQEQLRLTIDQANEFTGALAERLSAARAAALAAFAEDEAETWEDSEEGLASVALLAELDSVQISHEDAVPDVDILEQIEAA